MMIFKLLFVLSLVISIWSLILFIFKRPTFKILDKYNVHLYTTSYFLLITYGLFLESVKGEGYFTNLNLVLNTLYFSLIAIYFIVKFCIYIHNRIPDPED